MEFHKDKCLSKTIHYIYIYLFVCTLICMHCLCDKLYFVSFKHGFQLIFNASLTQNTDGWPRVNGI